MARSIDFNNLSHEDLLYLSQRQWMITEAEFQGHEDLRDRVKRAVAGEREDNDGPEDDGEPDYESMTVEDLKAELSERNLSTTGNKAELVARLQEDDEEEED